MKKFSSEQIRFVTLSKVCYYFYSDNLHSMLALNYTSVKYGKDQKYLTNWFKIFVGYFLALQEMQTIDISLNTFTF